MKKILSIILLTLFIHMIAVSQVYAASNDYTIKDGVRVPIPETYILSGMINNTRNDWGEVQSFKEPEDIFINSQGYIFVADTGNNRVVKFDSDGKLVGIFKGPDDKPMRAPKGVFADELGNMYIADTGNERVLHLSYKGEFVEEFVKPESELLGKNFTFDPSKIAISPTGYIYVAKGESILMLDAYNNFRGYLGQTEIGFRLIDVLLRIFASEEQKKVVRKTTAAAFINMDLDEKGMIYATSLDRREGEIKKINSVGSNIYRKYKIGEWKLFGFLTRTKFDNESFAFGERFDDIGNPMLPVFSDIAVDSNGMVTVIEQQTARIYQYDPEGNLLTVFGGRGDQKDKFDMPVALDVDKNGRIYVLDRALGNIRIFEPTYFIQKIHEGVSLYSTGEYDQAYEKWIEVLAVDESYHLAHKGIANTLYKQGRWEEAMEEYKLAEDRVGYSKAFVEYRYEMFRKHFAVVVLALALFFGILIAVIIGARRISEKVLSDFSQSNQKMGILEGLTMALGVIFHPIDTFQNIKDGRGRLNYISGIIILFMVLVVRIYYMFVVHYPLADIEVRDSNLTLEAVKLLLPALTWVVASFAVTAILDGESRVGEIFLATSYCMVPYILVNVPLAILSQVLTRNEKNFYALMLNGTWIWILLLFFLSLKTLNDYRLFKTSVTYVISGLTMGLIWLVSILGYVLMGRIYQFAVGVFSEFRMMWL